MQTKETEKRRPGKRRGGRYKVLFWMNLPVFRYPYYTSPGLKSRQIQRSHALSDVHKSLPLQYPHSLSWDHSWM